MYDYPTGKFSERHRSEAVVTNRLGLKHAKLLLEIKRRPKTPLDLTVQLKKKTPTPTSWLVCLDDFPY